MIRGLCLAGAVLLVLTLSVSGALGATPTIESVEITRTHSLDDGREEWRDLHTVTLQDTDGAADLMQINVTTLDGVTRTYNAGDTGWHVVGEETATFAFSWIADNGLEGDFIYTVRDSTGGSATLTTPAPPAMPTEPLELTSPVVTNGLIHEVVPEFAWTGAQSDGAVTVSVLGRYYQPAVWQHAVASGDSVTYNADGSASEAELTPGWHYAFEVQSEREIAQADPRVSLRVVQSCTQHVLVYSAFPAVDGVAVRRGSDTEGPGWTMHVDSLQATVTDGDGYDDLTAVRIVDPSGTVHELDLSDPDGDWDIGWGSWGTLYLYWHGLRTLEAPTNGSYTIVVRDAAGHEGVLTTPEIPVTAGLEVNSPAVDGVTTDTTPTFSWSLPGDPEVSLLLEVEGEEECAWWVPTASGSQIDYNADGQAWLPELRPGYSYLLKISHSYEEVLGSRVFFRAHVEARSRFTLPAESTPLPELPGKLAYGICFSGGMQLFNGPDAVLQYGSDSSARHWLGPVDALYPDWSPDGKALLYSHCLYPSLYVDRLDGTTPEQMPMLSGQSDLWPYFGRWSPDGSRVVYLDSWWGRICVTSVESGDATALPSTSHCYSPAWSPDGEWVSYADDSAIYLVRPDGSDLHSLPITGVEGYSGYALSPHPYLTLPGLHSWSPDGLKLVTTFQAEDGGDGVIFGIGTVSASGGPLKPIFLGDPERGDYMAPRLPIWSPTGTKIVFASGHHSSEWATGSELWLINADGSGEPIRLTYDHALPTYITWWAPLAFGDVPRASWAYSAINTCAEAGIVGGYAGGYRPDLPVTRDQMAVYVSRALAGGDAEVPAGPASATFSDVPTDHWAYRYIEYAHSQGIVGGYDDGYRPTEVVNRAQMAVFISRAMAGGDAEVPGDANRRPTFSDVPSRHWAYRYVEYCHDQGVVGGYSDGYHPDEVVNRAQMAVYVARGFGLPM